MIKIHNITTKISKDEKQNGFIYKNVNNFKPDTHHAFFSSQESFRGWRFDSIEVNIQYMVKDIEK